MTSKLGDFVRAHRERIEPKALGLPSSGRRRTPGLRREELATLCGISSTWLTWLEQGRPVSASAKVLGRLANVLRLSAAEREYLFRLAERVDPDSCAEEIDAAYAKQARAMVAVIQAPAYVLDRQWNAIAWNDAASCLFTGWLGEANEDAAHNLLRYMFLQPEARQFVVDWFDRAKRVVAEFRADCGKSVDVPPVKGLIEQLLRQSNEFSRWWSAQYVVAREGGLRRFRHSVDGDITFNQVSLQLQGHPDLKVTMLLRCA